MTYLLDGANDEKAAALRSALDEVGDAVAVAGDGAPGGTGTWTVHVHAEDVDTALQAGAMAGRPRDVRVVPLTAARVRRAGRSSGTARSRAGPRPPRSVRKATFPTSSVPKWLSRHSRAGHSRAGHSRAGHSRAGHSRAGHSRAGPQNGRTHNIGHREAARGGAGGPGESGHRGVRGARRAAGPRGGAFVIESGEVGDVDEAALARATMDTGAQHVALLPCDTALTGLAQRAAARCEGQDVVVVPTASPLQGLAALAVHDPARDPNDNMTAMRAAAAHAIRCFARRRSTRTPLPDAADQGTCWAWSTGRWC